MILLILPLIWAAVLLPPWVLHVRERRADRSVVLFDRRMAALERSSSVRYVFGSYDPYRALPGARRGRGREVDRSYVAAGDEVGRRDSYPAVVSNGELYEADSSDDTGVEDDVTTDLAEPDAALKNRAASERGSRSGSPDATHRAARGRRAPRRPREVVELSSASGQTSSGPAGDRQPTQVSSGRERSAARDRPTPTVAERRAARNSRVALRRRRQIFFSLLGAFVLSLVTAIVLATPALWGVHAATVLLFAGYLSLLARHQHRMAERATKVRRIAPDEREAPLQSPGVVLVSGGSGR